MSFEGRAVVSHLVAATLIVVAGVLLGLAVNQLRRSPLPWWAPKQVELSAPSQYLACGSDNEVKPEASGTISQSRARALLGSNDTIFVDARMPNKFASSHIRGAINLPEERIGVESQKTMEKLLRYRTVVVYCDSKACACSAQLAWILRTRYQMQNVHVLERGLGGWIRNQYPIDTLASQP